MFGLLRACACDAKTNLYGENVYFLIYWAVAARLYTTFVSNISFLPLVVFPLSFFLLQPHMCKLLPLLTVVCSFPLGFTFVGSFSDSEDAEDLAL